MRRHAPCRTAPRALAPDVPIRLRRTVSTPASANSRMAGTGPELQQNQGTAPLGRRRRPPAAGHRDGARRRLPFVAPVSDVPHTGRCRTWDSTPWCTISSWWSTPPGWTGSPCSACQPSPNPLREHARSRSPHVERRPADRAGQISGVVEVGEMRAGAVVDTDAEAFGEPVGGLREVGVGRHIGGKVEGQAPSTRTNRRGVSTSCRPSLRAARRRRTGRTRQLLPACPQRGQQLPSEAAARRLVTVTLAGCWRAR